MEQLTTLSEINQLIDDLTIYKKDLFITIKDGSRPIVGTCPKSIISQDDSKTKVVPLIIKLLEGVRRDLKEEMKLK